MQHLILIGIARILYFIRAILMTSPTLMKLIFIPGINSFRKFSGATKAYYQFWKAKKTTPAYQQFLNEHHGNIISIKKFRPSLHEIPATSKESYVNKYSIEQRCVHGKIPDNEVVIDESSGSSGVPTNWVRGLKERTVNAKMIQLGIRTLYPNVPLFVINAFALGPWATGVNVTMSCVKFSKLKSLGPDKTKIVTTLKYFGTSHHYLIMGYPPFLKSLVETADINFHDYNITLIFGGEAMIEGMRDYLVSKGIKNVYSSYGASDIELNMAFESDFTISLRKLLRENPDLKSKLLKYNDVLPMIFQYNPSDFLYEENKDGELLITICREGYVSPKIRYNIHDRGHVMDLNILYKAMDELQIDKQKLAKPKTDLPLLFHYGRMGNTVSYFGANISPNDIQEVIYKIPELASYINSFFIKIDENEHGDKQLNILLELNENKNFNPHNNFQSDFFEQLKLVNQDFREAIKMVTSNYFPKVLFVKYKTDVFENADIRIKLRYS
jgi:phenylacetate-CoA ligase